MSAPHFTLITSASYVNAELAAEFGRLPPAFLPFGHSRLFQHQIRDIKAASTGEGDRIVLTLPESFEPDQWDADWLQKEGVQVLHLPDSLSLVESIKSALILGEARGSLGILHGDTLFLSPIDQTPDIVSVTAATEAYDWGRLTPTGIVGEDETTENPWVLTGWFSLRSASDFLKSLAREAALTEALADYHRDHPLKQVDIGGWLDFGHLQTFYKARAKVSTARSFNALSIFEHSVLKSGGKPGKLDAEATWFETVPPALRLYFPAFLGRESNGYRLAYEVSPTLHELYVFGALGAATWRQILSGCFDFMSVCAALPELSPFKRGDRDALAELVTAKTTGRLLEWSVDRGVDLDREWTSDGKRLPSLNRISEITAAIAAKSAAIPGVMHGDLCFPNMFYNFRQGLIKVIDPRGGVIDGEPRVGGDLRYDLAKLNHSLQGYDLILAGRYVLSGQGSHDVSIDVSPPAGGGRLIGIASELELAGQGVSDPAITAMTIHMFLSMLPLHADRSDRQDAFLANALRLFARLEQTA
ncbi:hypothetical protein BH09PSE1_BH09PSE1_07350 [soil metagenome]